jgi:glycosyltransferase involved in cell wall biosynthesis
MRILVDYRPALRRRTGVGEYIHQTAVALAARPHTGDVLCLFSASWKDRLAANSVPGADVVDIAVPGRLLYLLWHRLEWPAVERLTGRAFDVVHSAHPLLIPSRRAARVVTVYDLDFLDHADRTVREIRRDYPALAGQHARRADQVVVISRHTAEDVERRLGVPTSHITVCTPGGPGWPGRRSEPVEGGCILFVGTLEPRKNLTALLDAYERLLASNPDVPPLVLAGRITEQAAAMVARIGRPPLAGRVTLPGYVQPEALQALYAQALVFVMPSHTEGFGLPVVEAMTVGVPVVAANRGALPEVIGDAGVLVDPEDPLALAQAIGDLLGNRDRRLALSEAGRRQASRFTWRATAENFHLAWQTAREHHAERRG